MRIVQYLLLPLLVALLGLAPEPAVASSEEISIATTGAPSIGAADAPVVIVEFIDYQCPFCAHHFRTTLPVLREQYVDTGKLRYVVRHFPLEAIHDKAFKAHEAAHCADEQGHYWPMHERLLTHQEVVDRDGLIAMAEAVGLDRKAFVACLDSGRQAAAVRADIAAGNAAGVSGTPSFFLGLGGPGVNDIRVVKKISGAQTLSVFQREIDALLAQQD